MVVVGIGNGPLDYTHPRLKRDRGCSCMSVRTNVLPLALFAIYDTVGARCVTFNDKAVVVRAGC